MHIVEVYLLGGEGEAHEPEVKDPRRLEVQLKSILQLIHLQVYSLEVITNSRNVTQLTFPISFSLA